MKYSDWNPEHPAQHDAVPEKRCSNGGIGMHHKGAKTPESHEEHVEYEDPLYLLSLSPVKTKYGKENIKNKGDSRNK